MYCIVCAKQKPLCNCDANDEEWREDSGLLTDKTRLPVKELRFGDTGVAQNNFNEQATIHWESSSAMELPDWTTLYI